MATRPLDVMPANVSFSDGTTARKVRVFVADGIARIFAEDRYGRVEMVQSAEVAAVEPIRGRARPGRVETTAGEVWTISRGGGCGCGSPLKRFSPSRWVRENA